MQRMKRACHSKPSRSDARGRSLRSWGRNEERGFRAENWRLRSGYSARLQGACRTHPTLTATDLHATPPASALPQPANRQPSLQYEFWALPSWAESYLVLYSFYRESVQLALPCFPVRRTLLAEFLRQGHRGCRGRSPPHGPQAKITARLA